MSSRLSVPRIAVTYIHGPRTLQIRPGSRSRDRATRSGTSAEARQPPARDRLRPV